MIGAAVLLGGGSERMGMPKHAVVIEGATVLDRILSQLDRAGLLITILGGEPLPQREHRRDVSPGAGPAVALIDYRPTTDLTFVIACDVPFFSAAVIDELAEKIGDHDAAIPLVDGRPQFLCALYARSAFDKWSARVAPTSRAERSASMHNLVDQIDAVEVQLDVHPIHLSGFNTQEELGQLIESSRAHGGYSV